MRSVNPSAAVLIAAVLIAAAAGAAAQDTAGFVRVASSDVLELYLDPAGARLAVRDLRDGSWWHSDPAAAGGGRDIAPAIRRSLASPFQLSYTDTAMKVAYSADSSSEGVRQTVAQVPGGFSVTYELQGAVPDPTGGAPLTSLLGFSVSYLLDGDSLVVRLSDAAVREEGELRLVSLQVLPFLGANRLEGDGYLLVPDGCGALMRFRPATPSYPANLNLAVYGEEMFPFLPVRKALGSLTPKETADYVKSFSLAPEDVALPVFGMVRAGAGFLGIVGPGEEKARVRSGLSGYVPNYNRIGVEFVFRAPYTAFLSRQQTAQRYTKDRVRGDREVRYCFLPGPRTGYVELAARYRQQLLAEGLSRTAAPGTGLEVRVFCGIEKRSLLSRTFVTATRFGEVREVLDAVRTAGLDPARLTLVGWERNGFLEGLPRKLPPAHALGGEDGLRDLVAYAHGIGVPVLLEADYLQAVRGGFSTRSDVIHDADGLPVTDGLGGYLLSPRVAFERFAAAESGTMAGYGIDGVLLRYLGRVLFADRSDLAPFSRAEAAAWWRRIADSFHDLGLAVGVDGANRHLLDIADGGVYGVPLHASGYRFADEEVPFLPIALHGLVPFAAEALNAVGDPRAAALRALECGAVPSLELTAADPVVLRDTRHNSLYRSQYREVLQAEGPLLARIAATLTGLADRFITGHRAIAPGVYLTTYEGGTEVAVNYTDRGSAWRGRAVPARDFLVLPGGGVAP